MENLIKNIFVDGNTEHYYKSNRKFDDYTYFVCVVKSCQNKLKLMHATMNKILKNDHSHTAKEGKNVAAVLCFKLRLKEMAIDTNFAQLAPKILMDQAMTIVGDVTFPPNFEKKALKLIRNHRFRGYVLFIINFEMNSIERVFPLQPKNM